MNIPFNICIYIYIYIYIHLRSISELTRSNPTDNLCKKLAVVFRVALVEKELHQEPYTREEVCKELDIDVSIEQKRIINRTIGTVFLLY